MVPEKSMWARIGTFMLGSSANSLRTEMPAVRKFIIIAFAPSSIAFSAFSRTFDALFVTFTV